MGCSIDPERTLSLRLVDSATGEAVGGALVKRSTALPPYRQPEKSVGQSDPNGLFRIRMGTWDLLTIHKPGYAETHVGWLGHSYVMVVEARPDLPATDAHGTNRAPTRLRAAFPYIGPDEISIGLDPVARNNGSSSGTTTLPASMPAQ